MSMLSCERAPSDHQMHTTAQHSSRHAGGCSRTVQTCMIKPCLKLSVATLSHMQNASCAEWLPAPAIGVCRRIGLDRIMWQMRAQQVHPRYAARHRAQTP